jgi:hypothetical protein
MQQISGFGNRGLKESGLLFAKPHAAKRLVICLQR